MYHLETLVIETLVSFDRMRMIYEWCEFEVEACICVFYGTDDNPTIRSLKEDSRTNEITKVWGDLQVRVTVVGVVKGVQVA